MNLRQLVALLIAAAVFVLDRVTKLWIEAHGLAVGQLSRDPRLLQIVHTKNKGAAFGMFAESDHPLRTALLIGVSVAVLLFIIVRAAAARQDGILGQSPADNCGLALVMGGALGKHLRSCTATAR